MFWSHFGKVWKVWDIWGKAFSWTTVCTPFDWTSETDERKYFLFAIVSEKKQEMLSCQSRNYYSISKNQVSSSGRRSQTNRRIMDMGAIQSHGSGMHI